MKHISAYLGSPQEQVHEKFAWWPVRSTFSKKIIWLKPYVELEMFYDNSMRNPIKNTKWSFIYTEGEYLIMLLRKDETKVY